VLNHFANVKRICPRIGEFKPEAVLTVAHGYSWLTAARFAENFGLPLHLIVHDHWAGTLSYLPHFAKLLERYFVNIYKQAVSRLCVSPFMEAEYRQQYGFEGQVLYPSRDKNCPGFDHEPRTYYNDSECLNAAYAGNIFDRGVAELIARLAECLDKRGGRLLLFGPHSTRSLASLGLTRPNIAPQGLIASNDLIVRMREEADFVFVPESFSSGEIDHNMRIHFPSKLTDYTATGLPLLICGPAYCSAVRWAHTYAPIADVVTTPSIEDLDQAVFRLSKAAYRKRLGAESLRVGNMLFSYKTSVELFQAAVCRRDGSTS
jgi:hypothetical protein